VLSGICLFVGITEALPQKVSLIGLDLSGKPEVFGWFLFVLTAYSLATSLVLATLDLIRYYLPYIIRKKGANVTGSSLGFTEHECSNFLYEKEEENISLASDMLDIRRQRKEIETNYYSHYVKLSNLLKLFFDVCFPIVFSIVSIFVIGEFLKPI